MKYVHISLILLFFSNVVVAQSNFKPGYIVTNTNDSITGLIDFRSDIINSQVCRFKRSEKETEELYYPGSIAKYQFIDEGKYYVSHSITINKQENLVFLEYLVNGMMNLYYYNDPNSKQDYYFFEDENGIMTPITKKPDEIVEMRLRTDQQYIEALHFLFKDYPTILKNVNPYSFNRKSMIKYTKEYHALTCTTGEDCIDFENDYRKRYISLKFSIYGGLQIINYAPNTKELAVFGSINSLFPVVGGQFSISNPRFNKSLSLMIDISFLYMNGEKVHVSEQSAFYDRYKFSAYTITERLNLLYIHPTGKIRPTVECGFSSYFLFNRSSTLYIEHTTTNTTTAITKKQYLLMYSPLWGYNCGIGFNYPTKNNQSLFCRLSFEQVKSINSIKSRQIKFGFTF